MPPAADRAGAYGLDRIIVDGNDPGVNGDAYIAYKQIELVSAVAPNATIYYYTSADTDYDTGMDFALIRAIGDSFLDAYTPILERRKATPYGERERNWQLYRRGRYVEFNLIYDRGTLFGLKTGGNIDAILMSLPPTAKWA